MPVFPTQYSTLSAAALGDHIAKAYGFSDLTCRLLVRNVSDTYLLKGRNAQCHGQPYPKP
jgi:hypothetical protein